MGQKIRAVYRAGSFIPQEPCHFPEDSTVDLVVLEPLTEPPCVSDPAARALILRTVTERMQQCPLQENAPRLSRDQMHERR